MLPFTLTKWLVRSGAARYLPAAKRLAGPDAAGHLHYFSDKVLAAPLTLLRDPATFPDGPGADGIHLNRAAPRLDSPLSAGRSTVDRLGNPPPWGLPALRRVIAEKAGMSPHPRDEVFVTHGATAAFAATLDAFVNPGDRVVLFAPCSPLFRVGAVSRRARVRWVPTAIDEHGGLTCDPQTLARAMRGAKLVVLADPGNPSGAGLSEATGDQLAWAANKFDVLVYADETFARFRPEGASSEVVNRPNLQHRTLVAGSLTAGYGLAAARVGWLRGPGPLVSAAALTASLNAPFVPTVCQQLAVRELEADDDLFGPVREEVNARRRFAADRLGAMGLPTPPAAGLFFWVDVSRTGLDGRTFAERLLQDERVLVGPGAAFGPGGEAFVRVSVAEEDGRLREGLTRMARFVATLTGEPAAERREAERPAAEPDERPAAFSRV